jgi:excisionase family DNA binding protein
LTPQKDTNMEKINGRFWLTVEDLLNEYPFSSKKSIYQMGQRGRLKPYRVGRRLAFKRSDIEKFLESCTTGT